MRKVLLAAAIQIQLIPEDGMPGATSWIYAGYGGSIFPDEKGAAQ
jgi:hypothetical protein